VAVNYSDIADLARYITSLGTTVERATLKALLATSVSAEGDAKKNSTREFTGRGGRTLGGSLLNNIFGGLEAGQGRFPDIFVGVRTVPYGAIHEFGGTIKPVKAKKLWLPVYANAKKMTPREFITLMKADPAHYHLFAGMAAEREGDAWTPLFYLRDQVTIPERPYLRPALASAVEKFPAYLEKYLTPGDQ
jgi:phage gpG-like protein